MTGEFLLKLALAQLAGALAGAVIVFFVVRALTARYVARLLREASRPKTPGRPGGAA